jgi:CheY-like chemotaxis protein
MLEEKPTPQAPRPATVLCVEDEPVCMELVEAMMSGCQGVRLLKAYSGHDGVQVAQAELPDVVLLDMNLPDIGGLDVVRALSEQISKDGLRVVLLTADSLSIDVIKAMSLGATAYWRKPLNVALATAGLRRLLGDAMAA